MPRGLFNRWPEAFYHTLVEVNLKSQWLSMEPTFDQEFHEILLKKRLNFDKYEARRTKHFSNEFTIEGISSPQQDCLIKDGRSEYGDDLSFLKMGIKELSLWKIILTKFFFKRASHYISSSVRPEVVEIKSPITEEGRILTQNFSYEVKSL